MTRAKQMSSLAIALATALVLGVVVFTPAFAGSVELPHSHAVTLARPPQQDPTPTPPPPPDTIIQNIFNTIQFPFGSLVEALQNAIQALLRSALEPIQTMFEQVLSLWLQNPGILSNGNAALPGWDLIRDAWQFMYSIGVAFWPLTLAIIAAIAAKDAVAASTWGLGDLKQALGTWLVAVIFSATSLWWMDLANQLANAITSYILHNFAGPQFYPGSFMVFFSAVLPGLFLAFPLAGIIIIMFLLLLAITIFIGLTFAIIARLVLMYLLVALGPIAIILGVLPPLRFVTQMWTRGFMLVLALGPVNALLLKMAFNVAQYASSAPVVQGAAAFVGVFGLLSILITINFAVVKGVFGAVIAVAQQTMAAVKTVGQMVVAGALLMSGAGTGAAIGGAAGGTSAGGAAGGAGGGGGSGGLGGAALGGVGTEGQGVAGANGGGIPITPPKAAATNGTGRALWRPSGRSMAAAGSYLQTTRGPLAGFGSLLRTAGIDQMSQERAGMLGATNDAANPELALGLGTDGGELGQGEIGSAQLERGRDSGERESGSSAFGYAGATGVMSASGALGTDAAESGTGETARQIEGSDGAGARGRNAAGSQSALGTRDTNRTVGVGSTRGIGTGAAGGISGRSIGALSAGSSTNPGARVVPKPVAGKGQSTRRELGTGTAVGANRALGQEIGAGAPPRRANLDSISQSRAAMGFGEAAPRERIEGEQHGEILSTSALADLGAQESPKQVEGGSQVNDGVGIGSDGNEALESGAIANVPSHRDLDDSVSENRAAIGFGEKPAASTQLGDRATETTPNEIRDNLAFAEFAARDNEELSAQEVDMGTNGSHVGAGTFEPAHTESDDTPYAMPLLAPEADRTLSMLPVESDDARFHAAQLVSQYEPAEQGNVALALEHAMRAANEQHGIGWPKMGEAMERGWWSTHEAANNGIPLQEMARQMEPFSGTRDPGDYLAWQLTGGSEQFHLPSQQVAYLPAPGPYDYQAGRYIEQQTGGVVSDQEAAQMFYVIRDPATPGGGWNKGHQFIGEVNRLSRMQNGDPLVELDRWMQTNAPTRARMLWNIHFQVANTAS